MSLVAISQSLSFARPDKFTILCLNVGVLYQVIQSDLFGMVIRDPFQG